MNKGPIAYFVGNPVAAKLLMVFLIIGGIVAGIQLAVRPLPEIDQRTVVVSVESPDSSPREVEEDINRRVEESLIGLDGVARVVSEATEGLALIEVELETFADADAILADVKNAVDSIENFPPGNAELPQVEIKRLNFEVLTLAVSSVALSEEGLRVAAEGRSQCSSGAAVSVTDPVARYTRPGNRDRIERRRIASLRSDHCRDCKGDSTGVTQPLCR